MNDEREDVLDLPPEPDTPLKSVRDQLADLNEVENAKIITNPSKLHGLAVTSPSPDTTCRIAVLLKDASAYKIAFSKENGWENVEEVEATEYWNQHTLTTALD